MNTEKTNLELLAEIGGRISEMTGAVALTGAIAVSAYEALSGDKSMSEALDAQSGEMIVGLGLMSLGRYAYRED